jgi:putative acetyltransferase
MNNNITTRSYNEADAPFLAAIYYHTIHNINAKDYSAAQLDAWAPNSSLATEDWIRKWLRLPPIIAVINNIIVGFAEFEDNGHIDCFYCHDEYQGCGVGSALMREIESRAKKNKIDKIFAEVSITARPFFEAKGFVVKKEQSVLIRGMELTNFVMEKMCLHRNDD